LQGSLTLIFIWLSPSGTDIRSMRGPISSYGIRCT